MSEELMEVISGSSYGSYSFVHQNYIYRINKFTNKRVYLTCRLHYCRGAGTGVKGATRGEVYNFKLTKAHNHPCEEQKIRLFEVKQYVRDEARSTSDSSREIYERAVKQFNCYDISRACVEGLVKRSRERINSQVELPKEKWKRRVLESNSEAEETSTKRARSENSVRPVLAEPYRSVKVEEIREEELIDNFQEAAIVEIIKKKKAGDRQDELVCYGEKGNCNDQEEEVAKGVVMSVDDNVMLEWKDVREASEVTTSELGSEMDSSNSSDDLDELEKQPSQFKSFATPGMSESEGDCGGNAESLEESLLKIYSTSYFSSKDDVFKLLSNPRKSIPDDDGSHSMNSSNVLEIIRSASELCKFVTVKASQIRRVLIGKTKDLNELEGIMVEHLNSLMCLSGTEFFQKCFGESLKEAIEGGKRSEGRSKNTWSEEEIVTRGSEDRRMQLAVALLCYSGRAYGALGELVHLPGPHIARKWATNFEGYAGFTGQSFAVIREEVIRRKQDTINVCLAMEDVALKRCVEWIDDHLVGYVDLGFGRVESDGIPEATRAVIFYANALNSNLKLPVGYCLVDNLSSQVRANLLCQYISKLEFCGVKCVGVVLNDSVATSQTYDEFGVFVEGGLPRGSFHTNADEKCRVSPFVDPTELMRSVKSLLKDKKTLVTATGLEVVWSHIEFTERFFQSDPSDWENIIDVSTTSRWNLLCIKDKLSKENLPFSKYLVEGLRILKRLGSSELSNAAPTIDFVCRMVTIAEVFSCPIKFVENRLPLTNHKDTFAVVNKWIHYLGNMKFPGGQFVKDTNRKAAFMNLCMNLSSLKVVVRRIFDSSTGGVFNRFSLNNVNKMITRMGLDRNLLTPKQFQVRYLQVVQSISASPSANLNHPNYDSPQAKIEVDSTFQVTSSYVFSPLTSMCDCAEDFFFEKVVNIWLESTDCADCLHIMLAALHHHSDYRLLRDLLAVFRVAENCLRTAGKFPPDLTKSGLTFATFANAVLLNLTSTGGFLRYEHLFNSVEFGDVCHFTTMIKGMLKIHWQQRLLYLSREIRIEIANFKDSSLKYRTGQLWA